MTGSSWAGNSFIKVFQMLSYKIKMSYSCWKESRMLNEHLIYTIGKTIQEKQELALHGLQRFLSKIDDKSVQEQLRQLARQLLIKLNSIGNSGSVSMKKDVNEAAELFIRAEAARIDQATAVDLEKFKELVVAYSETIFQAEQAIRVSRRSKIRQYLQQLARFILSSCNLVTSMDKISSS